MTETTRTADLDHLYDLFDDLAARVGGPRRLADCHGRMDWPDRGVYFFFAPGETRASSGQLRLTRVGTHAVSEGSKTTLWDRLKQHYGTGSGSSAHPHGGNHRGSVYRLRVGEALVERHGLADNYPDWGASRIPDGRPRGEVRDEEYPLERWVSVYLRNQPFLWVEVPDAPSAESDRARIERNVIALASNYDGPVIDGRSADWLGRHSPSAEIRASGLWNVDHVGEEYDPKALETLAAYVAETDPF
ncbi:hypothetical protein [Halopelagius fulvigenes]|uniref:GIY-YIG domain-containing protein n=1 Tax=Halopelagius fulvigenes TaxID=1198324 RepID=A0ABD5U0J1_9EURY